MGEIIERSPPIVRAQRTIGGQKVASLEALRGLAALTVVVGHFLGSFAPNTMSGLVGSPLFAIANGPAAVSVFFVLSGYVLPLSYFQTSRTELIIRGTGKRWFRLALLTSISCLISYALLRFGLYFYKEASVVTGSRWLQTFGGSDTGVFVPSLWLALSEGSVMTFLQNASSYNVALWTMYHEFYGSFVSYALAITMGRSRPLAAVWFVILATGATYFADPRLISFIVGTVLAYITVRYDVRLNWKISTVCLVVGLFFYGYGDGVGVYGWMADLRDHGVIGYDWIYVHTACAVILILGCLHNRAAVAILSHDLFRFLGRVSFAMYVIHIPLLCSVAAYVYLLLGATAPHIRMIGTIAVFSVALVGVSYVLTRCDEVWMRSVNRVTMRLAP